MSNEYKDWKRDKDLEIVSKYPFLANPERKSEYDILIPIDIPAGWEYYSI